MGGVLLGGAKRGISPGIAMVHVQGLGGAVHPQIPQRNTNTLPKKYIRKNPPGNRGKQERESMETFMIIWGVALIITLAIGFVAALIDAGAL